MKMCKPHWDKLRQAIKSRGLFDLVSGSGEEAARRELSHLKGDPTTLKNFDPLMGSYWAICNNAMETIGRFGGNPLALLAGDPEHPELECPICFLNHYAAEHDKTCTEPTCAKGMTFDDWIDKAADGAAEHAKSLPQE